MHKSAHISSHIYTHVYTHVGTGAHTHVYMHIRYSFSGPLYDVPVPHLLLHIVACLTVALLPDVVGMVLSIFDMRSIFRTNSFCILCSGGVCLSRYASRCVHRHPYEHVYGRAHRRIFRFCGMDMSLMTDILKTRSGIPEHKRTHTRTHAPTRARAHKSTHTHAHVCICIFEALGHYLLHKKCLAHV